MSLLVCQFFQRLQRYPKAILLLAFNMLGQQVKTFENANEINVSDWAEGLYVLRITTADGKVLERKVSVK